MSLRASLLVSVSAVALSVQIVATPTAHSRNHAPAAEAATAPGRGRVEAGAEAESRRQESAPKKAARVQTQAPATPSIVLPDIVNIAAPTRQTDPDNAASEMTFSGQRVVEQPYARPGEFLEITPGLIVTQHSGEGKANQYFLRGFNLDHGTDLAIWVDGMPVNMRTHGHGQGYADISFLIPELIQSMRVRKGPYFADEGDFSSAGAIHIDYIDTMNPGMWQGTLGMFGYGRALGIKSYAAGAGNLLVAGEGTVYDGPWDVPDRMKKINGVVRYSQGTALEGFSITGMAYNNRWTSTDQVAQRAIDQGIIGRFGTLDPTDGGRSSRYSLSSRLSTLNDWGVTKVEAYAIRYTMTLFNNFTYFLNNEVDGDQFSQTDSRTILGFHGNHTFKGRLGPFELGDPRRRAGPLRRHRCRPAQHGAAPVAVDRARRRRAGRQRRALRPEHHPLDRLGAHGRGRTRRLVPRQDRQRQSAQFRQRRRLHRQPEVQPDLRTVREDRVLRQCRLRLPFQRRARRVITVDPATGLPADKVPFLVRSKGAEVGVTTKVVPGLESSVALFVLDYASELLFVGDAGTTEASRPSRRVGVEWTNHYQPLPWLGFDLDIAVTRARFSDFDPAGNRIPGSPNMVASVGVVIGKATGWFGAAKLRYFGPRPLIEDNSVRSIAAPRW